MTFDEIRQQLAAYRDKGLVREVWQSGGTFIVSMERGPNIRVSSKADLDLLAGILLRKAALAK